MLAIEPYVHVYLVYEHAGLRVQPIQRRCDGATRVHDVVDRNGRVINAEDHLIRPQSEYVGPRNLKVD